MNKNEEMEKARISSRAALPLNRRLKIIDVDESTDIGFDCGERTERERVLELIDGIKNWDFSCPFKKQLKSVILHSKIVIGCQKQVIDFSPYKIAGTDSSVGFCGGIYAGKMELCDECVKLQNQVQEKKF